MKHLGCFHTAVFVMLLVVNGVNGVKSMENQIISL